MDIEERSIGDLTLLRRLVGTERVALRRDRLRAVVLALEGRQAPEIAAMLGRARRSVQDWVYAYRDGGIDRIQPPPRPGRRRKLSPEQEAAFVRRFEAGPRPDDGVCTLRGKDAVRILEAEFGVRYTLDGAYALLHRLGLSCLRPRPRHERQDLERQAQFRRSAPLL